MAAAITDCDHVCTRCGEHLAECEMCRGMQSALVFRPQRGPTYEQRREDAAQERAIRRAADRGQGWP